MQTSLRKQCNHQGRQIYSPHRNAILANHVRGCVSCNRSHQVRCPGVQVRRQHAAGRQLEQCDAGSKSRDSGEGGGVGVDDGACRAIEVGVRVEVVIPVFGRGEERVAVKSCSGVLERGVEFWP